MNHQSPDFVAFSQAEQDAAIAGRKITPSAFDGTHEFLAIGKLQLQPCTDGIAVRLSNQLNTDPVMFRLISVLENGSRLIRWIGNDIDTATVIEVAKRGSSTHLFFVEIRPTFRGDVFKANLVWLLTRLIRVA